MSARWALSRSWPRRPVKLPCHGRYAGRQWSGIRPTVEKGASSTLTALSHVELARPDTLRRDGNVTGSRITTASRAYEWTRPDLAKRPLQLALNLSRTARTALRVA